MPHVCRPPACHVRLLPRPLCQMWSAGTHRYQRSFAIFSRRWQAPVWFGYPHPTTHVRQKVRSPMALPSRESSARILHEKGRLNRVWRQPIRFCAPEQNRPLFYAGRLWFVCLLSCLQCCKPLNVPAEQACLGALWSSFGSMPLPPCRAGPVPCRAVPELRWLPRSDAHAPPALPTPPASAP